MKPRNACSWRCVSGARRVMNLSIFSWSMYLEVPLIILPRKRIFLNVYFVLAGLMHIPATVSLHRTSRQSSMCCSNVMENTSMLSTYPLALSSTPIRMISTTPLEVGAGSCWSERHTDPSHLTSIWGCKAINQSNK